MQGPDYELANKAAVSFGLVVSKMTSLCPYAPVYRIQDDEWDIVIKRTGYPRSSAQVIADWLHTLRARNIKIVAPLSQFAPNPRVIQDSDVWSWVIYPFVDGHSYTASRDELRQAGRLLGQIHLEGENLGRDMLTINELPIPSKTKVAANLQKCADNIDRWCPEILGQFTAKVANITGEIYDTFRDRRLALPLSACCWDFKASNLIFSDVGVPTLIDPDHAGRIPRLYDTACAVLLFHCDLNSSPGTLWTRSQWRDFYEGYFEILAWMQQEYANWIFVLKAAWLDEALWLLAHFTEGWQREGERTYLRELAMVDFDIYTLG